MQNLPSVEMADQFARLQAVSQAVSQAVFARWLAFFADVNDHNQDASRF
ncbi:MAG TPA: hypothetical protein VIY49_13335 [Bryobacteraceae bacterium]